MIKTSPVNSQLCHSHFLNKQHIRASIQKSWENNDVLGIFQWSLSRNQQHFRVYRWPPNKTILCIILMMLIWQMMWKTRNRSALPLMCYTYLEIYSNIPKINWFHNFSLLIQNSTHYLLCLYKKKGETRFWKIILQLQFLSNN